MSRNKLGREERRKGQTNHSCPLPFLPPHPSLPAFFFNSQVKIWTPSNGFCFVTFAEHTAPVTGLAFLPNSAALVSASLDGTVRAYDLIRYRNFRTMTSPTPQQFGCVSVDPSGEV